MRKTASRVSVYPYDLAYGRLSPMVPAGICVAGRWRVAQFYLDSGAFYTLMHAAHAVDCGLDFKKGRKSHAQVGDGSLIPVFLHRLPMQIGGKRFEATVGFSEKLGIRFNLLGRQDVFQHFKICFHERRKVVTFQTVNGP
jgi:hypothetical protein